MDNDEDIAVAGLFILIITLAVIYSRKTDAMGTPVRTEEGGLLP